MPPLARDPCGSREFAPYERCLTRRKSGCPRLASALSHNLNRSFRPYPSLDTCITRGLHCGISRPLRATRPPGPLRTDSRPRSDGTGGGKCGAPKRNSANLHNWVVGAAHASTVVLRTGLGTVSLVRECPIGRSHKFTRAGSAGAIGEEIATNSWTRVHAKEVQRPSQRRSGTRMSGRAARSHALIGPYAEVERMIPLVGRQTTALTAGRLSPAGRCYREHQSNAKGSSTHGLH